MLYIVLFLHQTTTLLPGNPILLELYIVLFLHQTTTSKVRSFPRLSCISYYSYIKPQQYCKPVRHTYVVYRTIPTSNHNYFALGNIQSGVVYRTIPTSNHNLAMNWQEHTRVVYRTIPTSNHNDVSVSSSLVRLYIVLFLHQTTTHCLFRKGLRSCISYYSYIKPQLY